MEVQLELNLPPPAPRKDYPSRASPTGDNPTQRVACRFCGGVHTSNAEMLACKEGS